MANQLPEEILHFGYSQQVVEGVKKIMGKQNEEHVTVGTSSSSNYTMNSYFVPRKHIQSLYSNLSIEPITNECDISTNDIFLCVSDRSHISALGGVGKFLLSIENIDKFQDALTVNLLNDSSEFVPSLAIVGSRNKHHLFHIQLDIDRDKNTIQFSNSKVILNNAKEIEEFTAVWNDFFVKLLRKYNHDEVLNPVLKVYRSSKTSGIHLFVQNVKVSYDSLQEVIKIATSDHRIKQLLLKYNLKLDTPSNLFIIGCEKRGRKQHVYKEIMCGNTSFDSTVKFPVCTCGCVTLNVFKKVPRKRRGTSTSSQFSSKRRRRTNRNQYVQNCKRRHSDNEYDCQPSRKRALISNDLLQSECTINSVKAEVGAFDDESNSDCVIIDHIANDQCNISEAEDFNRTIFSDDVGDPDDALESRMITPSIPSVSCTEVHDFGDLGCDNDADIDIAAERDFGGFSIFLPENQIPKIFNNNVLCLAIYEHVVPLMFQEMACSVTRANQNTSPRRYTYRHLCTVLVTYAHVIWRNDSAASRYTRSELDFCFGLIKTIMKTCAYKAEANLSLLWQEVKCYIVHALEIVKYLVTDKAPSLVLVIFTLLHISFWSTNCPSSYGTPLCSGEYLALCQVPQGMIKEYLRNRCSFLFGFNTPEDEDENTSVKRTEQAQAINRIRPDDRNAPNLPHVAAFLLGIAYVFDGEYRWSSSLYPAWEETREDEYRSLILEPALNALSNAVSKCKIPDAKPKKAKDGTEKIPSYKLCLSISFYLKSVQAVWKGDGAKIPLPAELVVTSDYRVFCIDNGEELHNIPCFRFARTFATGTTAESFQFIRDNYLKIINLFTSLANDIRNLPQGAYLSYPDGKVVWDTPNQSNVNIQFNINDRILSALGNTSTKSIPRWILDLYIGWIALFELMGFVENLEKVIRFFQDIKYRGYKKKYGIFFSKQPNHGKSTFSKVIQGMFEDACYALSFPAICAESDSTMTNSAIVGTSGKMLCYMDELPAGSKFRASMVSMHKVRMMTGGTRGTGYRQLYTNCSPLTFACALCSFSNEFPRLSETNEADLRRLIPIEFPRKFCSRSTHLLMKKISLMHKALDAIMLALEICGRHARNDNSSQAEATLINYLRAMNCKTFDGKPFTIEDDGLEMDQRTCPKFADMMQFYNEESRLVSLFVSRRNMNFKYQEWKIVAQSFKAFVEIENKCMLGSLDKMLEKVKEQYLKYRDDDVTVVQ